MPNQLTSIRQVDPTEKQLIKKFQIVLINIFENLVKAVGLEFPAPEPCCRILHRGWAYIYKSTGCSLTNFHSKYINATSLLENSTNQTTIR